MTLDIIQEIKKREMEKTDKKLIVEDMHYKSEKKGKQIDFMFGHYNQRFSNFYLHFTSRNGCFFLYE